MKLARIMSASLLVSATLLPASGAQAAISAPGSSCVAAHPAIDANIFSYSRSIAQHTNSRYAWLVCPLPAEKSIGETAEFDIQVLAYYAQTKFRCVGTVFDSEGDLIAATPIVTSTGSMGMRRLSTEVEVGSTESTSYTVACYLDGHLVAIRAH